MLARKSSPAKEMVIRESIFNRVSNSWCLINFCKFFVAKKIQVRECATHVFIEPRASNLAGCAQY